MMKKYLLLLLIITPVCSFSGEYLSAKATAKNVVDDLKKRVTRHNNSYYIENKPILFDFDIWERRLQNTFEHCDELGLYHDDDELEVGCYNYVIEGYAEWIEAAQEKNINHRTWMASASESTQGGMVDFKHWVRSLRVYSRKFEELDKVTNINKQKYAETSIYDTELRKVTQELLKEETKTMFKNTEKINQLKGRQRELNKIIRDISKKYE